MSEHITFLKLIRKINPGNADMHYRLGLAYIGSGDRDSALEEYNILKTLDADKAGELFNQINGLS